MGWAICSLSIGISKIDHFSLYTLKVLGKYDNFGIFLERATLPGGLGPDLGGPGSDV